MSLLDADFYVDPEEKKKQQAIDAVESWYNAREREANQRQLPGTEWNVIKDVLINVGLSLISLFVRLDDPKKE